MDRSYPYAAFDNRRPAGQHGGGLVTEEVQTQTHKDEQGTKDEQRGEELGVDKSNESDESSESGGSDYSFVPSLHAFIRTVRRRRRQSPRRRQSF